MFDKLKKKIASKLLGGDKENKVEYVPFFLKVGSSFNISTTTPIVYDTELKNAIKYSVTEIGKFVIGDCTGWVFIVGDNHFLEVITKGEEVQQCRLYYKVDTITPTTEEGWNDILGPEGMMRAYNFEHGGNTYERLDSYADPEPDFVDPVKYAVHYDNHTEHIQCMCFGRWLNEEIGVAEYALVYATETTNSADVGIFIGIDVSPMEID